MHIYYGERISEFYHLDGLPKYHNAPVSIFGGDGHLIKEETFLRVYVPKGAVAHQKVTFRREGTSFDVLVPADAAKRGNGTFPVIVPATALEMRSRRESAKGKHEEDLAMKEHLVNFTQATAGATDSPAERILQSIDPQRRVLLTLRAERDNKGGKEFGEFGELGIVVGNDCVVKKVDVMPWLNGWRVGQKILTVKKDRFHSLKQIINYVRAAKKSAVDHRRRVNVVVSQPCSILHCSRDMHGSTGVTFESSAHGHGLVVKTVNTHARDHGWQIGHKVLAVEGIRVKNYKHMTKVAAGRTLFDVKVIPPSKPDVEQNAPEHAGS